MKYFLFVLVVFLTACSEPSVMYRETVVSCNKEKAAEFILQCAAAANPMSDEEGEDLVYQCELTSKNLFCEKGRVLHVFYEHSYVTCSEAIPEEYKQACINAGFVYNKGE